MLPFLAYPRRFTQHAVTAYWRDALHKHRSKGHRIGLWIEIALFIVAFALTLMPFFTPVHTFERAKLIYIPQLLVGGAIAIRTFVCASWLVRQERNAAAWQDITLTGLDARQLVLGKWWVIVRYMWKHYRVLLVLKVFVAYALATHFYYSSSATCTWGLNAFCYGYPTFLPDTIPALRIPFVYAPLMAIAIMLLILFTLMETALVAAIGLLTTYLWKRRNGVIPGTFLRFWLIFFAMTLLIAGNQQRNLAERKVAVRNCDCYEAWKAEIQPSYEIDMVETLQTAVSTLMDGGTLMATQFMRGQIGENNTILFIIRSLGAAFGGLILNCILLWVFIRAAVKQVVDQGGITAD